MSFPDDLVLSILLFIVGIISNSAVRIFCEMAMDLLSLLVHQKLDP
jgi:hypothetical protein